MPMILKVDFLGVARPSFRGGGSFCTECGGFGEQVFFAGASLTAVCQVS